MNIVKPIFIVGNGRSGSTIFHRVFAEHPAVAWLSSRLCNRFPHRPAVNRWLMQAIDQPLSGRFLRRRFQTGEGYAFWEYYCKGFSEPYRDLVAQDVTHKVKRTVPQALAQILTPKRHRLLLKITGWPRIGFLQEIFPDARFIHIRRDPRAVVNSLLDIDWWAGWRGPQGWRAGELTPAQRALWEESGRSFVALAALEVQILEAAMTRTKPHVPPTQLMEIDYETFCLDPAGVMQEVVDFCDLAWSAQFAAAIGRHRVESSNYKWQADLTPAQQAIMNKILAGRESGEDRPTFPEEGANGWSTGGYGASSRQAGHVEMVAEERRP